MKRWLSPLAGLLGALLLLLVPTADRSELRNQVIARVLADDASGERALFGALAAQAQPEGHFELRAAPSVEAVFATALNVYNSDAAPPARSAATSKPIRCNQGLPLVFIDTVLQDVGFVAALTQYVGSR